MNIAATTRKRPPTHIGNRLDRAAPPGCLSVHEVARELRVSVKTILRKLHDGTFIPCIRLGRTILFRRATLDRWLAERETMTGIAPHRRTRRAKTQ